jgi:hypothetical protein
MSKRDFWFFIGAKVLSLVFIFLKVDGFIDWPWYWLISPVWVLAGMYLASYVIVTLLFLIDGFIHRGNEKE